ncbi:MAG TPA: HEAT repeat domain-containing protein [Bryobacteraceae bacterium]|nr:HEAT repeat domain-containing protein [Bryobacteraceae bacterium]
MTNDSMNPQTLSLPEIEALFSRTLVENFDTEDAMEALRALQSRGSRDVLEYATAWCKSDEPLKRSSGVIVLGQLGDAEPYGVIAEMLKAELDPGAIHSAISALGHLGDLRAIPLILPYADHVAQEVRFSLAVALGTFANDPRAISCLLQLTSDVDDDVRDWAVFSLGVLGDADSPEIRDALLRCLQDGDVNVREEAAVGLGKRRDERVVPRLLEMLALGQSEVKVRVAEATVALLGLVQDPPEWGILDYKDALRDKFGIR